MTSPADLSAQQIQEENQALTDEQRNMVKMALAEEAQLAAQAQLPKEEPVDVRNPFTGETLAKTGARVGSTVGGPLGGLVGAGIGALAGWTTKTAIRERRKKRGY